MSRIHRNREQRGDSTHWVILGYASGDITFVEWHTGSRVSALVRCDELSSLYYFDEIRPIEAEKYDFECPENDE